MCSILVIAALFLSLTGTGASAVFGTSFTVYENDTAQLEEFRWLPNSSVKEPIIGGEYAIQFWGSGEQLYERSFRVSFDPVIAAANGTTEDGNGTAGPRSKYFFYRLPYEPSAERFAVVHGEQELINITIPDRICRADGECPAYCRQQGREDADCEPRQQDGGVPVLAVIGAVLMLAGVGLFLWHRRDDDDEADMVGPRGRGLDRSIGQSRGN